MKPSPVRTTDELGEFVASNDANNIKCVNTNLYIVLFLCLPKVPILYSFMQLSKI